MPDNAYNPYTPYTVSIKHTHTHTHTTLHSPSRLAHFLDQPVIRLIYRKFVISLIQPTDLDGFTFVGLL